MAVPDLYQFSFSHYNEKARWALDYKGIRHHRHSLLPGAHIPQAVWISGRKSTPILVDNQKVIAGSANIIDHLEQKYPRLSLYPRSLKSRKHALEIARWFDDEVGSHVRRALFHEILPARRFCAGIFSQGFPEPVRTGYRLMFPGLVPVLKLDMSITKKGADFGLKRTEEALDFIVANAGEDGYLVDDRFSVADLTAASLLMITCFPPELQFRLPEPQPPQATEWAARWRDHPGVLWIRRMFQRHRGQSAELAAA